jgi:hypothetical protein
MIIGRSEKLISAKFKKFHINSHRAILLSAPNTLAKEFDKNGPQTKSTAKYSIDSIDNRYNFIFRNRTRLGPDSSAFKNHEDLYRESYTRPEQV